MNNLIITLTGPSCSGKSTLERMMCDKLGFERVISTTTRPMRAGDIHGVNYHFMSKSEFKRLKAQGFFVEAVEFNGNYYGVSVNEINRVLAGGKNVVIVVEPEGHVQIAEYVPYSQRDIKHVSIFVDCPESVIADRFLRRFVTEIEGAALSQIDKAVLTYSDRLSVMMTTERGWIEDARSPELYDLVIPYFGNKTEQEVLDTVKSISM